MEEPDESFEVSPVCRVFQGGDEGEAERLLRNGPRVPALRITKFEQDHQPLVALLVGLVPPVGVLSLIGFVRPDVLAIWWIPTLAGSFGIVFSTAMAVGARYGRNAPKEVHIDADTGNVQLDGEVVGSLAEFYAPRLLRDEWITIRTAITEERKKTTLIYVERVNADPFQLFTYPVAIQIRDRLPQIADHLNALITEYNYRQDVRRWLEEREAGQAPYRRPEAGGLGMSNDRSAEGGRVRRVHMDTLEYTRQGLRTREPLALEVGQHHRVVIVRPDRRSPSAPGARGFPHDSSFPLLATLRTVWAFAKPGSAFTHHRGQAAKGTAYQVFGHTSASGDEAHNKALSERRAAVGLALLRSDAHALRAVGDEEGWGAREYQSMLRTLACDPGPTDGLVGRHTEAALQLFRERYQAGVYHRRLGRRPAAELEEASAFDEPVLEALFDAFVHAHGAAIAQEELHPSHPAEGCSEFNRLATTNRADGRRLTIIAHPAVPEHHENAPCIHGDAAVCAVVDDEPMRCMFYREHVSERARPGVQFADPRWLWLGEDRYLLSALTDLDGDADVVFEVYDAPDRIASGSMAASESLPPPRAESLQGAIWSGVAQVVWRSGQEPTADDGCPAFEGFPTFRVRDPVSGANTLAPWPETRTLRILVGALVQPTVEIAYVLRATDGSYERELLLSDAVPDSGSHFAVQFEDVPLDVRVSLFVGPPGAGGLCVFEGVVADSLPGNCSAGTSCREVKAPVPPPDPATPTEIDEDEDIAVPWLEGDEEEFVEPGYG